jgi:hypothetical protein
LEYQTNRTLRLTQVSQFDQSGSYWVVVDNGVAPAAESAHALLTVNAQPTAVDDFIASGSNQPVTFAGSKLLFNDSDSDGDALSLVSVNPSSTNGGTASLSAGLVTYTPTSGFTGTDMFTYTLGDARGGRSTGRVFVTVGATNFISVVNPPTFSNDGHFLVGYSGIPGYVYTVERSTNVVGPWSVFTNVVASPSGLFSIDDPNTPPEPIRFYRVIYP